MSRDRTPANALRYLQLSLICITVAHVAGPTAKGATEMKLLEGLEDGERLTTHLDCLEAATKYLGIDITPGWLYGGTGHAFVMSLGEDLCPSGPHCWGQGPMHRLARNLPFRMGGVAGPRATPELSEKAWDHVRAAIAQGHPCYGWHWEWVLITGFDDEGYFYSGMVEPPKDWRDFGAKAIGFVEIYSVEPAEPAPDEKTILDSLRFAVDFADNHGDGKHMLEGYDGGLEAYDTWIRGLEEGRTDPHGLAYHTRIWLECRTFAADFLEEANARTGGRYSDTLEPAARHYRDVAKSLGAVDDLLGIAVWPPTDEQKTGLRTLIDDPVRRDEAIAGVRAARAAEEAGLATLRKVIAALERSESAVSGR
ncbi:hypothetical protein HOI71_29330 [Candidatus Poribacteria bacterium]|nr:hypothetical protein [Candidatus Poribacteria bacterium]